MQNENLNELFDQYTLAFNALDASEIARCYTLPCATCDGDGQAVYDSEFALIEKFTAICKAMVDMGYMHSRYKIHSQDQLGSEACAVTVGWKTSIQNNDLEFRGHYVCHKQEGKWKIFTAQIFHGTFE